MIEGKCGSNWYDVSNTNLRCQDEVIEDKCGTSNWYNSSTKFCSGSTIYSKCDGNDYNPSTQRCQDEVIETRCGSGWYNPAMQFCSNGTSENYVFVIDNRDNKTYKAVVIDTQTWMAENLNYNENGSKCGSGGSLTNANTTTCGTYGRLYDWSTAMGLLSSCNSSTCVSQVKAKHRGICPNGWHIPSNVEWTTLINYVGSNAGTRLKVNSFLWNSNGKGTDDFGFAALPGGYGSSDGSFYGVGTHGYWWTATEGSASYAYGRYMYYSYAGVDSDNYGKTSLRSVRCLQDSP